MEITKSQAREIFDYRDGNLYWRIRPSNNVKMSEPAGYLRPDGYRVIKADGRNHQAHRLIWIWHYGEVPEYIDHKDGNPRNNHIENLRLATISQNNMNCAKNTANTSGYKGVSWHKGSGKFQAHISINGRNIYLGYFTDQADAHAAYVASANKNYGEFARVA